MIDHRRETLMTLREAAASLPRRRGGKKVNVATVYRWALHGFRGVRLEAIQVGGTKFTSAEALQRFFDRLSDPERDPVFKELSLTRSRPLSVRAGNSESVDEELDRLRL
jgi:hypothetical protein